MKYSDIIDVQEFFKSAFDITSDKGESWKAFITNEKFESNMAQIINCFTSSVLNNRKSIWIQGTYGTGKSHSLAVIKHLLCDDYSAIEDYISRINRSQLRNSISNFRREKGFFRWYLREYMQFLMWRILHTRFNSRWRRLWAILRSRQRRIFNPHCRL